MSKIDKAKERLSLHPKDYTYSEAKYLLSQLGFEEFNKGKTSGSRVKFYRASDRSYFKQCGCCEESWNVGSRFCEFDAEIK